MSKKTPPARNEVDVLQNIEKIVDSTVQKATQKVAKELKESIAVRNILEGTQKQPEYSRNKQTQNINMIISLSLVFSPPRTIIK